MPDMIKFYLSTCSMSRTILVMTEAQIEESILQWLNSNGFFAWKNNTGGYFDTQKKTFRKHVSKFALNGASDVIALRQGVVYFIEVKTILGVQSNVQKQFERKIKENKGNYLLVRSVDDIKSFCCENILLCT